jgi:hypothetical protein
MAIQPLRKIGTADSFAPAWGFQFMSMSQLVIGCALGCLLAQALIFTGKSLLSTLQRSPGGRLRRAITPGPRALAMFVKYAAPVAIAAALIILGVWSVSDYLAAKSARTAAMASTFDPGTPPQGAAPAISDDNLRRVTPEVVAAQPAGGADPYDDPEFKVQHRAHRAANAALKDALLQKAELKASNDLRRETQGHTQRSQYDCEAADRAERYLKAGLDVWGFAAWQQRYFPMDGYRGATLDQCRSIKAVMPGPLDLQSTVAQQTR